MSSPNSVGPTSENVGPFQLSILALSVLALVAIAVDAFVPLPPEISKILQGVDLVACTIFFVDFVIRFSRAPSKLAFMKWGWIDLLASIPNVDWLRLGRFARLLRVLRVLRGVRSIQRLLSLMFAHRTRGGVASVAVIMFFLVVASSIGILLVERGEQVNIKTAGDAVWWSVTTVTTVGYGDRFPITPEGRVIAIGLMLAGVGMFGALSGIVASFFLGKPEGDDAVLTEVRALKEELGALRAATTRPVESERTTVGESAADGVR
jgi:voltage-gated potassium channel